MIKHNEENYDNGWSAMNYLHGRRSYINSFIEGLLAPWCELIVSLVITYFGILHKSLEAVERTLNTTSSSSTSFVNLMSLFSLAIMIMSLFDVARNIIVGFRWPGNAVAHILGELVSLTFLFGALILVSKNITVNCLISVVSLALGILIRFYYEKGEEEY